MTSQGGIVRFLQGRALKDGDKVNGYDPGDSDGSEEDARDADETDWKDAMIHQKNGDFDDADCGDVERLECV